MVATLICSQILGQGKRNQKLRTKDVTKTRRETLTERRMDRNSDEAKYKSIIQIQQIRGLGIKKK